MYYTYDYLFLMESLLGRLRRPKRPGVPHHGGVKCQSVMLPRYTDGELLVAAALDM